MLREPLDFEDVSDDRELVEVIDAGRAEVKEP